MTTWAMFGGSLYALAFLDRCPHVTIPPDSLRETSERHLIRQNTAGAFRHWPAAKRGRRMYLHNLSRPGLSLAATRVAAPQARLQVEAVAGRAERALADRAVVGVQHDADGLPLAGRASRRGASGSGGEQLGQERILLAQGLVRHPGDLAVARRGDQGDDPAALEKAQDALADTLELRLLGRRPHHGAPVGPPR